MGNETTRIFVPDGGNDALTAAMMGGGCGMNGMWNNPIWAIVFLAALQNGGFFGNNGRNGCQLSNIQEQLNTIQGQNSLMSAIQGGTNETRNLANTLNCDINAVQAGINAVQQAICTLGGKTDMNAMQIVNAINSGDTALANQLATCCCQTQQNILKMGYENQIANMQQTSMLQQNFAELNYRNAEQACANRQTSTDNTNRIIAKIDAVQDAAKDEKIASLTAALTAATSRAERQAELSPIYKALADIQCKQPNTVTIPYPQLTALPTALVYGAAANGGFNGYGPVGQSLWS